MEAEEAKTFRAENNIRGLRQEIDRLDIEADTLKTALKEVRRERDMMTLRGKEADEMIRQYETAMHAYPRRLASVPNQIAMLLKEYMEQVSDKSNNSYAKGLLFPFDSQITGARVPQLLPEQTTTSSVHSQINFNYGTTSNPN